MTREKLLERKAGAQKALQTYTQNAQLMAGVIADCDYWLAELDKAELEAEAQAVIDAEKASKKTSKARIKETPDA